MSTSSAGFELHPSGGIWTAFRQQVGLLGASGRWAGMTLIMLLLMVIVEAHTVAPVPFVLTIGIFLLPVAAIWAILVWSGEGPRERGYHWSMPVPRAAHELARVAAGALYLVAMYAVFAVADAIMAGVDGHYNAFEAIEAQAWASYFIAPLVVYALVMPLVLWRDYTIVRWVLGALFVLGVLTPLAELRHIHTLSNAWRAVFFTTDVGLGHIVNGVANAMSAAVGNPDVNRLGPWHIAAAVWLSIGLLVTAITATFRPDDLRRIFRRGAPGG